MDIKIDMKPASYICARLGIDDGGKVHAFFTDTCAKAMDKYVPFDTGTLAETVILKSGEINRDNVTANTITYAQEYAKYVYYGLSKYGEPLTYHTDKHELATDYWDKEMWSAQGDDIIKQVQDYMEKHGGK